DARGILLSGSAPPRSNGGTGRRRWAPPAVRCRRTRSPGWNGKSLSVVLPHARHPESMKTAAGLVILGGRAPPDQGGIVLGAVSPRVSLTRTALRTRDGCLAAPSARRADCSPVRCLPGKRCPEARHGHRLRALCWVGRSPGDGGRHRPPPPRPGQAAAA